MIERLQGDDQVSLTVVILTFNEIIHIERAISSVRPVAQRIIVIDSGSTDGTIEKAREMGAEVFERRWVNYADQMQWAFDHGGIDTDWTMRLDADEYIGSDLAERLRKILPALDVGTTSIELDRRHIFMGRWIRFGDRFPLRLVRIWRTGRGRIEQRWMDEHVVIDGGHMLHVPGEFCDANLNDLVYFTAKHNAYATREAIDVLIRKYGLFAPAEAEADHTTSAQARVRRAIKQRVYNWLPLGVGPLCYFFYRYILRGGFLDGKAGLIYHGLQGLWYRFLVDARKHELERALGDCTNSDARIDRLTELTGHDLRGFAGNRA